MTKGYSFAKAAFFCSILFLSGCSEDEIFENIKSELKTPVTQDTTQSSSSKWQQLPGTATDIAIGADGSVYKLGTEEISQTGGYDIYKWSGSDWQLIPGAATSIAVDSNGDPWVVNKSGLIFRRVGNSWPWQQLPGTATDIAIGADGSVYKLGTEEISQTGGYDIYKWSGSDWQLIPGAATSIAVDSNGDPWVVNKSGLIFRRVGNSWPWQQLPGTATDIAIGADGSVYKLGTEEISQTGGYDIYKWSGSDWQLIPGAATSIAVDSNGTPWVVNKSGLIFKLQK